jgi:hypothetical protein
MWNTQGILKVSVHLNLNLPDTIYQNEKVNCSTVYLCSLINSLACSSSASKRKNGYRAVGNAFFIASPLLPPSFGLSLAYLSFQLDLFSPQVFLLFKFNATHPALGRLFSAQALMQGTERPRGAGWRGRGLPHIYNQNAEVKKLSVVVIEHLHNSTF